MSALEEPQGTHNVVEIASGLNLYNESGITASVITWEMPPRNLISAFFGITKSIEAVVKVVGLLPYLLNLMGSLTPQLVEILPTFPAY